MRDLPPHVLVGDMNQDYLRARTYEQGAMSRPIPLTAERGFLRIARVE